MVLPARCWRNRGEFSDTGVTFSGRQLWSSQVWFKNILHQKHAAADGYEAPEKTGSPSVGQNEAEKSASNRQSELIMWHEVGNIRFRTYGSRTSHVAITVLANANIVTNLKLRCISQHRSSTLAAPGREKTDTQDLILA